MCAVGVSTGSLIAVCSHSTSLGIGETCKLEHSGKVNT